VLLILGSLFSLRSYVGSPSSEIKRDPYIGLGQVLAQETAKLIDDQGRVGVVIADFHQDKSHPMASEWNAFRDELKQHRSIELATTEVISSEEITPEWAISAERFEELLKAHSDLKGMVFFVGLPLWDTKKPFGLPPASPKIIATPGPRRPLKPYFTSGAVSVLIVPRFSGSINPKLKPKTSREWFDMLYEVYTTQNSDSLPDE